METTGDVVVLRGEDELFARTAHLFATADAVACAANDLHTWAAAPRAGGKPQDYGTKRIRKLYRPAVLLDPRQAEEVWERHRAGAEIRITRDEVNETIMIDDRLAILAGDGHSYTVITRPEVLRSVTSLFNAAWRAGTDVKVFDANFSEVRALAPRILDVLVSGCKDETAARTLGLGLRTYRRRVAELMGALGATSRFQAGARARELGLV